MSTDFETNDLLQQVKQLERANRRWKIAVGLATLLVFAVSMSPSSDGQPPDKRDSKVEAPANDDAAKPAIRVDDKSVAAIYANFSRVTGTPEELIMDFGLNPQPFGQPVEPIQVSQRVVMNFYTAKRFWQALTITLQRHEAAFGVLETDVQKRVLPAAK